MTQDVESLKRKICEVGQRLYHRSLVSGSDGNLSVRLTTEEVLCTPSALCKGRMRPEDICLVNMRGEQLAGMRRRSSEVMLHLEILQARPDIHAVVHSHPPYATAFAVAGEPLPRAVTAEAEIILGEVPIAPYATPGTAALARSVLPFVERTNVCLLANHGAVTYAKTLEQALCLTEALEAYCQTLSIARQLGPVQPLGEKQFQELLSIRRSTGFAPPESPEKT